jgi:hypothetical protein
LNLNLGPKDKSYSKGYEVHYAAHPQHDVVGMRVRFADDGGLIVDLAEDDYEHTDHRCGIRGRVLNAARLGKEYIKVGNRYLASMLNTLKSLFCF